MYRSLPRVSQIKIPHSKFHIIYSIKPRLPDSKFCSVARHSPSSLKGQPNTNDLKIWLKPSGNHASNRPASSANQSELGGRVRKCQRRSQGQERRSGLFLSLPLSSVRSVRRRRVDVPGLTQFRGIRWWSWLCELLTWRANDFSAFGS